MKTLNTLICEKSLLLESPQPRQLVSLCHFRLPKALPPLSKEKLNQECPDAASVHSSEASQIKSGWICK